MEISDISIDDILRESSIGLFYPGCSLGEIGNEIGTPEYWDFSPGKEINFYAVYGPLEVYFRGVGRDIIVYLIKLKVFKFRNRRFVFKNIYNERALRVSVNRKWRTFEGAISMLRRSSIKFSIGFEEPVKEDTSSAINVGKSARLYFRKDDEEDVLDVVELS